MAVHVVKVLRFCTNAQKSCTAKYFRKTICRGVYNMKLCCDRILERVQVLVLKHPLALDVED